MNIIPREVDELTYDILTVQPMYLYEDDIQYIKENVPELLKDPEVEYHDLPPIGPIPGQGKLVEFICNNGWGLIKGEVGDENYWKVNKLVCEYRKKLYIKVPFNSDRYKQTLLEMYKK